MAYKLARAAGSAAAAAAAAWRASAGIGRLVPSFPRGEFTSDTACTRTFLSSCAPAAAAAAAPSGAAPLLRRGLATLPDDLAAELEAMANAPVDPAVTFCYGEEELASDESAWAMYERWRGFHGVERDHDEMARRFDVFKANARKILESNRSSRSRMKLNVFDDWTEEENSRRRRNHPVRRFRAQTEEYRKRCEQMRAREREQLAAKRSL